MKRLLLCLCLLLIPLAVWAAPPIPPLPTPVPATVQVRPPVVTPAMRRYSEIGYVLYFAGTAYALLILWGVLASGLSARLRRLAERLSRRRFLALCWYYLMLTLVLTVLQAPLTFYGGYLLDHEYGLSHQSLFGWLGDQAKGLGIGAAITILLLWLLLALIRRSPRCWALWLWAALIPIIAFGIFAEPIFVEPLFNKFTPMPASPLRARIETLAAKAGILNAPIYVVDKSKQTNTTNAYVTGIGSSARIVLWDTLFHGKNKMPDDQIIAIVGHEMGHYVLRHIYLGFAESVLGLLVGLPLLQALVGWMVRRFGPRWRVADLTDLAAIPAFLFAFSLLTFLADPITNGLSRRIEHAADAYGLAVTQNRVAMAQAFVSLSEQNLDDPNPPPFIKFWLYSHPPLDERIAFALGRKPNE